MPRPGELYRHPITGLTLAVVSVTEHHFRNVERWEVTYEEVKSRSRGVVPGAVWQSWTCERVG